MTQTFQSGDRVRFAAHSDNVFIITECHSDGSYTIETELNTQQRLRYENIVQEMLRQYDAA